MEIDQIRELLDRYYEAQTTDAEEHALHQALLVAGELPDDLEQERMLLRGFTELTAECAPARMSPAPSVGGFSGNFADSSADPAGEGAVDSVCGSFTDSTPRVLRVCVQRGSIWRGAAWMAVAAMLIAGVVLTAGYLNRPYGYINGKPVRDAEVAMRATTYLGALKSFDRPVEMLETLRDTNKK